MLPASGTFCTELIPTGSIETVVLTGVCSTSFLLMVYGDGAVKDHKHRDQYVKQKDHRNAPWKSLFQQEYLPEETKKLPLKPLKPKKYLKQIIIFKNKMTF